MIMHALFIPQTRFKSAYSTAGYLPADSSSTLTRMASRLHLNPPKPAILARIDYSLPLVYDEEDAFLSLPLPSDHRAVAVQTLNHSGSSAQREERLVEIQNRIHRQAKNLKRGLIDNAILERARHLQYPFMMGDLYQSWTDFGPDGFPVMSLGILVSANVVCLEGLQADPALAHSTHW